MKKITFLIQTKAQNFLDTRLLLANDEVHRKPVPCTTEIANSKMVQKKCNKWRPTSFMENKLKLLS